MGRSRILNYGTVRERRMDGAAHIDQPLDSTLGRCFNRFQESIQDSALAPACSLAEKISLLISVT